MQSRVQKEANIYRYAACAHACDCFDGAEVLLSAHFVLFVVCCPALQLNPFRTAVPFWGQTSQISSSFVPKRDCGSKGVKNYWLYYLLADRCVTLRVVYCLL